LRLGEALGIDIKNISPDCTLIKIKQKAWKGEIHDHLKTPGACADDSREIDLHPSVAAVLKEYIDKRKSGLLFCSKRGKQLWQSNILRRSLHPALVELEWEDAELGLTKAGAHAFRRFRYTHLQTAGTTQGLIDFWMGHRAAGMSGIYDKVRRDMKMRKGQANEAGVGFDLPSEMAVIGRNGRKRTETPEVQMAASA
jgi:integrase